MQPASAPPRLNILGKRDRPDPHSSKSSEPSNEYDDEDSNLSFVVSDSDVDGPQTGKCFDRSEFKSLISKFGPRGKYNYDSDEDSANMEADYFTIE